MSKKPLAETNRRVFEVLWVLLIFALFYVGINSALMVYHSLASAIEEVARFGTPAVRTVSESDTGPCALGA